MNVWQIHITLASFVFFVTEYFCIQFCSVYTIATNLLMMCNLEGESENG